MKLIQKIYFNLLDDNALIHIITDLGLKTFGFTEEIDKEESERNEQILNFLREIKVINTFKTKSHLLKSKIYHVETIVLLKGNFYIWNNGLNISINNESYKAIVTINNDFFKLELTNKKNQKEFITQFNIYDFISPIINKNEKYMFYLNEFGLPELTTKKPSLNYYVCKNNPEEDVIISFVTNQEVYTNN